MSIWSSGVIPALRAGDPGFKRHHKSVESPIVKWLSLLTLNQPSGVRISVGEEYDIFAFLALYQLFQLTCSGNAPAVGQGQILLSNQFSCK